ncbi:polysaccharide biosynthesis/export family protein [Kaistella palustris]|uniref:polysaccharide biosynthesis/export family protein n=1 Tax=Kaistella palustris TaxID=493376 RepID=UPI000428C938|nr:polysaccharide biosynthesis/export family protein [Kaistella palustris]
MNKNTVLLLVSFLFFAVSCKPKQKVNEYNYLQSGEQIAVDASNKTAISTIQKGDQLEIFVSAKNMDVVKPFNQTYYSSQNAMTPGGSANTNIKDKPYLVDSEGNIDFPVLGTISTTGKTLEQLKEELTNRISQYVKDPVVSVTLANFRVTVLGEVSRPGQYTLEDINPTILNAIGMAGDLTIYGKRDNVLLVRNVNGEITKERINLMDDSFISSPYYQLKQGDVIYVSANPTREKIARLDPNTNIYIAVAGTIIGLAGIFITIFKK